MKSSNQTSELLGKKITFSNKFIRQRGTFPNGRGGNMNGKTWNVFHCKPTTGFIVGRRVLQEGFSEWYGDEHGMVWMRRGSISAYIVATAMNKKPTYIPITEVDISND